MGVSAKLTPEDTSNSLLMV